MAEGEESQLATRPKLSPPLPSQLTREPSRDELDIARHLTSVQQAREAYAASSSTGEQTQQEAEGERMENGGSEAHHHLRDSLQAFAQGQRHQSVQDMQGVVMQQSQKQHRPVPSGTVPGGQMCRYEMLSWIVKLKHDTNVM